MQIYILHHHYTLPAHHALDIENIHTDDVDIKYCLLHN